MDARPGPNPMNATSKVAISSDALIVGGGPAGLAAAIALRMRGLDVLVADAMLPPIDKACGEGLMPDAQRDLAALGIAITPGDGAAFHGISFFSGNRQVSASFAHGRGVGLRRPRLHALMVERCRELGVRLMWGARVAIAAGQPILVDGAPCRYRYLIGADGQASRVRQWSGLNAGAASAMRLGFRRHFRVVPWTSMVEVHWCDLGEAYITPVASDEICVAILTREPAHGMDAVLASLPRLQLLLRDAVAVGPVRGGASATRKLRRVTTEDVALVGDASGSVDAVTGEGMALSFRQALLLAESIAAEDLERYRSGHAEILHRPRIMSHVLLGMDRWPWFRACAMQVLAEDPQLFGRMLAAHLGEESLQRFLLRDGAHLGWQLGLRLLTPSPG